MIHEPLPAAIAIFALFVAITLGLSFYLGAKARSAGGYFAASGGIPWWVNGVAFAGDYLSAASFLGICGMIAFYGYDGFLYSIGYLAGWIVALLVIAEPLKRLGKYTFADALDARFQSRAIKLTAGISTLVVSVFYLIPQMVGAGSLIRPLLGLPHWSGVVIVGAVVVTIVVTAGMVSTTYVQFLKGGLLVLFTFILTWAILDRGLTTEPEVDGEPVHEFERLGPFEKFSYFAPSGPSGQFYGFDDAEILPAEGAWKDKPYVRLKDLQSGRVSVWRIDDPSADAGYYTGDEQIYLVETQTVTITPDGMKLVNGLSQKKGENDLYSVGRVLELPDGETETGPLGPLQFFSTLQESVIQLWRSDTIRQADGTVTTVYYPQPTSGDQVLSPGNHPAFAGLRSENPLDKLNFLSLMLALFCGTAALPHILIRYYTVKDQAAARKSTIVGIACIGAFYVLTLYLGLGAMTSGALDLTDSNMAAPLLARAINHWLFAIISAIAFTTVLGTVSGLVIASSGAVVHDFLSGFARIELNDREKVRIGKLAAIVVGGVAIVLGILFEKMNVSYLVGWAFSIAASANLPALVMLLFWRGTTRQGIATAIVVGMASSLGWILASGDTYKDVYGLSAEDAIVPFSQPGIVTIPLGFATLVVVSLLTQKRG